MGVLLKANSATSKPAKIFLCINYNAIIFECKCKVFKFQEAKYRIELS